MFLLYHLILLLGLPFIFIYFFFISARGNIRGTVWQRFGKIDFSKLPADQKRLWFHAASVGEVRTALPLIKAVKKQLPDVVSILVSVITQTGYEIASKEPEIDHVFYLPVDLPWIIKFVIKKAKPTMLVVLETELWPNLFRFCSRFNCPILIANARISQKSLGGYQRFRFFMAKVLAFVDKIAVQNETYLQRYLSIGARQEQLVIAGDIKEELALQQREKYNPEQVKKQIHLPNYKIMAAVSTHSGEEQKICETFLALKKNYPALKLIIAPRHVYRAAEIEKIFQEFNIKYCQRSKTPKIFELMEDAILWDTFGELGLVYAISTIVFVGGSLVPVGGHSLMEPAIFGVPVIWGGHVFNFSEAQIRLLKCSGGIEVHNQTELLEKSQHLLTNESQRIQIGQAALNCALQASGAVTRHLELIVASFLNSKSCVAEFHE
ncbi:3-deoxy-D-manno-octulosonic acid transferase [candidate division KSB1 bacterium]|nr:3-deoxy-D-manno-octulosonic acid transferase [candidate division KSB1 bacterium]